MPNLLTHDGWERFGGVVALAGVSFQVEPGEIVGVVGPNGAGKTTLFDIIAGLQPPTSGSVEYDGRRITGLPAHRIARLGLARTFQIPRLFVQLDEAMSGLNDAELGRMMDLVRGLNRDGTTFVLVEHVMKVVMSLCARVVVIDHGAVLVEDVPAVVVKDRRVIEAYLGQEIDVPA